MNEYNLAQIEQHCELIKKGKPLSVVSLKSEYVKEATQITESYDFYCHIDNKRDWCALYICQDENVRNIVLNLPVVAENQEKSWKDHFIIGALCGYDVKQVSQWCQQFIGEVA